MERIKKPSFSKTVPDTLPTINTSTVTKWIPLLFAGAAAGVSIIALNEIKKVRKEIISIKKDQSGASLGDEINKRMENMEGQLKLLADFVQNKETLTKKSNIIRNAVNESELNDVHIINGEEYEEVEVTDDENEEMDKNGET